MSNSWGERWVRRFGTTNEALFVADDKGRIKNAELANYRLLTAMDMPPIQSGVVDSIEPTGPWGVKEVGEGATNPTLGMFSNAICDAMGVRVNSLPLTYEKVWRALKEKREREACKQT